jgi:hypothetical protein
LEDNVLTKADVKLNNDYDYVRSIDPTTAENMANGYMGGQTWINTDSGESFQLTDPERGTWSTIEESDDARITRELSARGYALFRYSGPYFYVFRATRLTTEDEDVPASIDRALLETLSMYQSVYDTWTVTNNGGDPVTSTLTGTEDMVGSLGTIIAGDEIEIRGSQRLDGLYTVTAKTPTSVTVEADLAAQTDAALVVLLTDMEDWEHNVGRMIWFDLYIRNKRGGLSSERIGTYSWNAGPSIGGLSYPEEIAGGFRQYISAAPGGLGDLVG